MTRFKLADVVLDVSIAKEKLVARTIRTICWHQISPCWHWYTTCPPMISWCRPIHTTIWWEYEIQECPGGSRLVIEHMFDEWDDPRELVQLKEQLVTVLERLDAHQALLNKELQPQSLDEVKALEEQMRAATAALAARKKELGG